MNNDKKRYILAIDIGTTSIRTIAFDTIERKFVNIAQKKLKQYYPKAGWVEQDPREILSIVDSCLSRTLQNIEEESIFGLGLTNQRETFVAWKKSTGEPLYNAIVWQDRRTFELSQKISANRKMNRKIHNKTGLFVDAYFSATKINWLIQNNDEVRSALEQDDLNVATLDSYVIYHLTQGKSFVTDHSNACRTLLYNIHSHDWDNDLLKFLLINK